MLTRTPSVRFTMFASLAIAVPGVAVWSYCAASQIPDPKTEPKIIDPGDATRAPSDAVVLFDGKDLSKWVSLKDGGPAKWEVKDGAMVVVRGAGDIRTKQEFDDFQLHIEWATPAEVVGEGRAGVTAELPARPLRSPSARLVQQQDLLPRPGRLDLQTIPSAGQRLPQTRRVADLRHHLPRADLRRRRKGQEESHDHRPPKRRPDPGSRGSLRHDHSRTRLSEIEKHGKGRSNCRITAIPCGSGTSG